MKTKHIGFILFITTLFILSSCKKEPINRDIEGFWKLTEFTTTSDEKVHPCERIYYSIQLQIAELSEKGGSLGLPTLKGLYRYDEAQNRITINQLYYQSGGTGDFSTPDTDMLNGYGLNSANTEFEVIKADGKNLVIRSDYATLTLRRF